MKKIALALAAMAMATSANAATVIFDFGAAPHQNNLGPMETYTIGGLSIIASGFSYAPWWATPAPIDLYGKHDGATESGLGLDNDPQHEIKYQKGFVQLDVSGLFGQVLAASTFFGTNSTTNHETWAVYGTNTAGTTTGSTFLGSGETQGNHLLPSFGSYKYYDFVSIADAGGKNFLITSLTTTTAVPEPAAWALMLGGFGGLGALLRRRRAAAPAAA
jgi:hypothetical protein